MSASTRVNKRRRAVSATGKRIPKAKLTAKSKQTMLSRMKNNLLNPNDERNVLNSGINEGFLSLPEFD
jgi:hypothetical protein